ncbi:hypothetical protein Pmar_PMAR023104 [Perkinsus marinus ATCC 50983]|uniref:CCHC-type domain-containing protein n=1 Tax=Perkinsus marinus (strain ATCC 50983 / TXsc) TaxID=423536 RepID=C5LGK4_PERM5|nr:hypothetical protein Pmar_PMAR023104 [Perkinsus marinus ATCC 50983]EER04139.1 hypothetical protein Pmar_PMAR023104 [Perkinsus marinus ATCC 50983]|eukprot:XP_002772323.1 hypothetical protein Pmar_PMAR023104 [Perkinsus marinus ATCC 50983]
MRAVEVKWLGMRQQPGESIPAFADRVEDIAHIKETLSGVSVLDAQMSERLADGLTDGDSILAKSLIDPLLKMPYEEFKQSMLSFLESMNSAAHLNFLKGSSKSSQLPQNLRQSSPKRAEGNSNASEGKVHSTVALELGLDKDACIRCGHAGHRAGSCTGDIIYRQHDRCDRCGKLIIGETTKSHKCDRSRFRCSRCN